jgi:hypothetical protein
MKYLKSFNESIEQKLYYHGRRTDRNKRGENARYIYLTDNIGYGISFSDMKELYVYTLNFPESKVFKLSNPSNFDLLKRNVDKETFRSVVNSSDKEIDWASFSNLGNDEYELGEDLLQSLGFKAIKLRERPNIYSVYVFDENDVTLKDKIDLTTPEMIKFAGDWFANPGFTNPDEFKYNK